jgi:cyclophilin family peptidyl-prolyl cis-trans isomerase
MPIMLLPLLAAAQPAPAQGTPAQAVPAVAPLPSDPVAADWKPIPDDQVMIVTLTGNRTVVIRLAPDYAPEHVANVSKLALAHWWDGTSVYRVQEGWVTQWGGSPTDSEDKPLPDGVAKSPAAEFDIARFAPAQKLARADAYSTASGITADGWAVASDGSAGWLTHCYGTVGVARGNAPDTGSGGELFTPIGQAARRLDRNYTIVGRVIEGMKWLSAMPRSDGDAGFYKAAGERATIVSARLASDIPAAERPHFEYRAADNPRFAAMIDLRLHPKGLTPLGGIDVCDVPLAARRVGAK